MLSSAIRGLPLTALAGKQLPSKPSGPRQVRCKVYLSQLGVFKLLGSIFSLFPLFDTLINYQVPSIDFLAPWLGGRVRCHSLMQREPICPMYPLAIPDLLLDGTPWTS